MDIYINEMWMDPALNFEVWNEITDINQIKLTICIWAHESMQAESDFERRSATDHVIIFNLHIQ